MKRCKGLRFSHERPMTAQEREWVEERLKQSISERKVFVPCAVFICVITIVLLCVSQPQIARNLHKPGMVAFVYSDLAMIAFQPAMFIFLVVKFSRNLNALRRSLTSDTVEVYAEEPRTLERIPSTGLLLYTNPGRRPKFARLD